MDHISREHRSWNMSRIRGSGNRSTELKIIHHLRQEKVTGWRRKYKLFGKPDFVFPKKKIALFVDGCFWHGHKCAKIPSSNRNFWERKINANKKRDRTVNRELKRVGWSVFRVWECEIGGMKMMNMFKRIRFERHE